MSNKSGVPRHKVSNSWNAVANKQHAINKQQPVKIYTKEEIKQYESKILADTTKPR
jgi:hypothetical protein